MDDQDDLFALLKSAHGILGPKGRTPKPFTADQIPAPVNVATHIGLLAIKNMRHVNAIAENQHLAFGATGMTVIYGDNGSGKSGYSRVLKRACRARDQTEAIYPNAHLPADKAGMPEAIFEITVDGVAKDVQWTQGKVAPTELSSLAIFDSRCARAYLDSEDDFSYVPYGLDVFEALAKVCKQLKTAIDTEHAQSAADLSAFVPLQGDTPVGKPIASLSARTTQAQIRWQTDELTSSSKRLTFTKATSWCAPSLRIPRGQSVSVYRERFSPVWTDQGSKDAISHTLGLGSSKHREKLYLLTVHSP